MKYLKSFEAKKTSNSPRINSTKKRIQFMKYLKTYENYKLNESIWMEVESEYEDDEYNIHIDAWKSNSNDEDSGSSIATINIITGEVTYKDKRAKTDFLAQEVINDVLESLPEIREERKDEIEEYLIKKEAQPYNL